MPGDNPAGPRSERQGSRSIRCPILRGSVKRLKRESLGKFLHPFQAAFAAADAKTKTIFHACRGLRHPKTSSSAVFKSEQCPGKVMDEPSRHDCAYLGRHFHRF